MSKHLLHLLAALLVGHFALGDALAQSAKIPRIGWLEGSLLNQERHQAFLQGLRDLGYIEGKNIIIEWRTAEGDRERQRAQAAELVRLKVDIIVASGGGDTRAAQEATKTIPIVMAQTDDPVASGFVASLARPGGNITGLSTLSSVLSSKRLEILKDAVPKLSRVALFGSSSSPANVSALSEMKLAAEALKVSQFYVDVLTFKDIESAFRTARVGLADGVLWNVSGLVSGGRRTQIAEWMAKSRLPTIFEQRTYVQDGALMSYGVHLPDLARRAATYVDKILKGTKPADLPVEQPTKFEFIVNLKAAKQIGLTIPPNVLARADRVIR